MSDVLRFDLAKDPKGNPIVYGRVGDSNGLTRKVKVFDDGKPFDLTGWTTTFEGNTSKYKTKVFDSEGITVDDPTNGEFSYVFPNMDFAVEGQYERAYFSFTKNGIRRSSGDFEIIVFGNADINAAEAETVITEYNKLVAELQELQKNNIADLQEQQDTYIQSTDNTFAAIQGRITNLQNTIKGFETSADEVAETIQTRLSELAKRLDELELGVRLHDAYAWSADGTDRFTKVYPRENLVDRTKALPGYVFATDGSIAPPSAFNNELATDYLPVDPGQAIYTQQRVTVEGQGQTAQGWQGIGYYDENKVFISRYDKLSQVTPVGTETYFEAILTVPANARFMRISWRNFSGSKVKVEKGSTPTIYTPAPSEDYANAYPTYKGISIVDSDNPADYSWQAEDNTIAKKATLDSHTENISNPHKVTKTQIGLGNVDNYSTATQAEAEAGESNSVFMTPERVKQQTDKRLVVESEALDATDNSKLMTPKQTKKLGDKYYYPIIQKFTVYNTAETAVGITFDDKHIFELGDPATIEKVVFQWGYVDTNDNFLSYGWTQSIIETDEIYFGHSIWLQLYRDRGKYIVFTVSNGTVKVRGEQGNGTDAENKRLRLKRLTVYRRSF